MSSAATASAAAQRSSSNPRPLTSPPSGRVWPDALPRHLLIHFTLLMSSSNMRNSSPTSRMLVAPPSTTRFVPGRDRFSCPEIHIVHSHRTAFAPEAQSGRPTYSRAAPGDERRQAEVHCIPLRPRAGADIRPNRARTLGRSRRSRSIGPRSTGPRAPAPLATSP